MMNIKIKEAYAHIYDLAKMYDLQTTTICAFDTIFRKFVAKKSSEFIICDFQNLGSKASDSNIISAFQSQKSYE